MSRRVIRWAGAWSGEVSVFLVLFECWDRWQGSWFHVHRVLKRKRPYFLQMHAFPDVTGVIMWLLWELEAVFLQVQDLSLSVNRWWHEVRFCGGGVCWMWQCFPARTVDYLRAGPHWHLLFAIQNIKHKWKWVALKQNSSLVHCPEAHGIRGTSGEKGQPGSLQTGVSIPP